jgi:adenosylhomocysteinase
MGVVEDTENGHQKYEALLTKKDGYVAYPCPIMSVARSALKDPEDFLVGQAVVFSADALLREKGMILTGKRAVVMGYGKIGSSIANCLRTKALRVDVIDNNPVRLALALAHGFHTANKSELLGAADLIFCATGNKSLVGDDFAVIKKGAFVFTATSGDDEISDYQALLATARPSRHARVSVVGSEGRDIFLCNNGNSANFMHGGVVGPFIKLVQAELIFALSQLQSMQCREIRHLSEHSKRFIADLWLNKFASAA